MEFKYDVIIFRTRRMRSRAMKPGFEDCLITMDMNKIGQMSCNPAVGGIAKGRILREIDCNPGGIYMGLVTDQTAIQFRILNRSKVRYVGARTVRPQQIYLGMERKFWKISPTCISGRIPCREILVENGRDYEV